MFNSLRNSIKGGKTYIVAVLMVLVGIVNLIAGDQTAGEFVTTSSPDLFLILNGLGLAGLRAAVSKATEAAQE